MSVAESNYLLNTHTHIQEETHALILNIIKLIVEIF